MKELYLAVLFLFIGLGTAEEILRDVQPGAIDVNLGDGYKMSFVLDESFAGYDLKIVDPKSTAMGKHYHVVIY